MPKTNITLTDHFNKDALERALSGYLKPTDVVFFECCDSTNNEAKRLALSGDRAPTVIAANSQTAGRGRLGRSFYSPAQTGVYFSILYPIEGALKSSVSVTGACAVAVMRALYNATGIQTAIKWVNDLYLNEKKVCGILVEALSMEGKTQLIIGIGINLCTDFFPEELQGRAGSLGCNSISRAELIASIFRELLPYLKHPANRLWLEDYRRHSMVIGRPIEWICGEDRRAGYATGIDEDGALEVRLPDGATIALRTGEISLRIP